MKDFQLKINGKTIESINSISYNEKLNSQFIYYFRRHNKIYLKNEFQKLVLSLNNKQLQHFLNKKVSYGTSVNLDVDIPI